MFHFSIIGDIITTLFRELLIMTNKVKTNTVKFKINEHLLRLIKEYAFSYKYTETEYIEFLIKKSLYEFEERIEHENPSKVLAHMKDAMDFFQFDDNEVTSTKLERNVALNLKLTCKEFEKDMIELTTMFICYSILRD